ncbi:uncharacterized protein UV8b_07781 [Ustilaginoidea virens]|uniref:CorA family metal ion transporter n=1 Tax=Ustilaginoidea virens TaxID=1159556 RepID=A0A8E5HXN4_USTVR|nr:uncharacterized protein UV8b_07781 [Ustilaginoidea virens]QUC23540.1 hypothetical protein UV8b_07781 [Ustilaginoidea virens]
MTSMDGEAKRDVPVLSGVTPDGKPAAAASNLDARPPTSSSVHVTYEPSFDSRNLSPCRVGARNPSPRSDPDNYQGGSVSRRRSFRTATFKSLDEGNDLDSYGLPDGWQPGSEPGYDPELPDGGHASVSALSAECQITVVDFSTERMVKRHFENSTFIDFLNSQPQEDWVKCRWINVNGLSWDVVQAVGNQKGLHRLALEDTMNLRNRTKAEWYPNHAFIIMTLQKLVHIFHDDNDVSSDSTSLASRSSWKRMFQGWVSRVLNKRSETDPEIDPAVGPEDRIRDDNSGPAHGLSCQETWALRSLQRYHASGNDARTEFMERHSTLAEYKMAVSAEQVSIFLTNDNTVISFFEISAADVESPIVTRLSTPGTILRESCDASFVVQAIIDAIIDLALPLTAVYTELLADLELDVLTSPSIRQSRKLYICISEINKMLRFFSPIDNLVNVLRDHRTLLSQENATREPGSAACGVTMTPLTHTYLGDVLDHCIIITEAFSQLKQSSEDLINLIFNTISANQSQSMKQLTMVAIVFLPMTFITGFFGQNFDREGFPDIHNGIWYFWACAVPTAFATMVIVMRGMIFSWFGRVATRKQIWSIRKRKRRPGRPR